MKLSLNHQVQQTNTFGHEPSFVCFSIKGSMAVFVRTPNTKSPETHNGYSVPVHYRISIHGLISYSGVVSSLVPRLSWEGKESLVTTACTCAKIHPRVIRALFDHVTVYVPHDFCAYSATSIFQTPLSIGWSLTYRISKIVRITEVPAFLTWFMMPSL